MPGLTYHVKTLELIIAAKCPELDNHLVDTCGLTTHQIYLHDWIICLFTSIMPIGKNLDFISEFIRSGWVYFYKMALAILKVLEPWLISQSEID
jgi:hypothetical protein